MPETKLVRPKTAPMELAIDPEFASLLGELSSDEEGLLEQNLLAAGGATDPVIFWQGVIVDGHNRYRICRKHGLKYDLLELVNLTSRESVKRWICHRQLGRRNLAPKRAASLRAEYYRDSEKSLAEVSEELGVSETTLKKDVRLTDALKKCIKPIRVPWLNGDLEASQETIIEVAKLSPTGQKKVLELVSDGGAESFAKAIPIALEFINVAQKEKRRAEDRESGKGRIRRGKKPLPKTRRDAKNDPPIADNRIKPTHNHKEIDHLIRKLTREIDMRMRLHGACAQHQACVDKLNELLWAWNAWKKRDGIKEDE